MWCVSIADLLPHRYVFNRTADFDTVRQIKERFCYVACDFNLEKRLAYETCVLEKGYQVCWLHPLHPQGCTPSIF